MTPAPAIHPSILNADQAHLADELDRVADADGLHVDIMDNHFVPNHFGGPSFVEAVLAHTALPVDAHLMIEAPDRWAPVYAEAGCASVTFHAEAASAPLRLAREIRAQGRRVGLALRPATGIEPYVDILGEFDMILVMTVEPGFGGQSFIESMMPKVSRTRKAIRDAGLDVWVQVDGGVSRSTIEKAAQAGANNFVAGSAVYRAEDAAAEVEALRQLAAPHVH